MSNPENLQERARTVVEQGRALADDYDLLQAEQWFHADVGDGYSLELRTNMSHRTSVGMGFEYNRYIYLKQEQPATDLKKQCPHVVVFSLSVHSLMLPEAPIRGITNQWAIHLSEVMQATGEGTPIHGLFAVLADLMPDIDSDTKPTPTALQPLELAYEGLVAGGIRHGFKDRRISPSTERWTSLKVRSMFIDGSEDDAPKGFLKFPRTELGLYDGSDRCLKLYDHKDVGYETTEELSDSLEAAAMFAEEDDIRRNAEGKVVSVSTNSVTTNAILEAARAMGLRDVRSDYLDQFESALEGTDS